MRNHVKWMLNRRVAMMAALAVCLVSACFESPGEADSTSETVARPSGPKSAGTRPGNKPKGQVRPRADATKNQEGARRPETCADILEVFRNPCKNVGPPEQISNKYDFVRALSGGKSGSRVELVREKSRQELRVFKMLAAIGTLGNRASEIKEDPSYLEIFNTCRLANMHRSIGLPPGVEASVFFPRYFGFGLVDAAGGCSLNPPQAQEVTPYFVTEAIPNISMTDLALSPKTARSEIGFDLDTAPPMAIESILLQLTIALKNADVSFALQHNDLHTGNILLMKTPVPFKALYKGKSMPLVGPLVKIIDFGLAESAKFTQRSTWGLSWIKKRPIIEELEKFISEVNPSLSYATRLAIYRASPNPDLNMLNLLIRALKARLNQRGSTVPDGQYCDTYDTCLDMMSKWWH